MINPFDLSGPEFLYFYGVFAILVLVVTVVANRNAEDGEMPALKFDDPYRIAFLRGGKNEALRVATLSLVDRGLLEVNGEELRAARDDVQEMARRPLEKALLQHFLMKDEATSVFSDTELEGACRDYESDLERLGLLPNAEAKAARRSRWLGATAILGGVAATKVLLALSRGRTNIWFLIIGSALAIYLSYRATHPRRTTVGTRILSDLRTMLAGLKERGPYIRPGGMNSEAALLAAVFGFAALPETGFAAVKALYPKAQKTTAGSCGASCGAGCGSSCGGGCGGGCGGCGG